MAAVFASARTILRSIQKNAGNFHGTVVAEGGRNRQNIFLADISAADTVHEEVESTDNLRRNFLRFGEHAAAGMPIDPDASPARIAAGCPAARGIQRRYSP